MTRLANVASQVRMGEIAVATGAGVLRTLLGSCIGLVLYDRRARAGGLAHIVLPNSQERTDQPGKYVDTAIPELIKQIESAAGGKLRLTARYAGGANMFSTANDATIGFQNAQRIHETLNDTESLSREPIAEVRRAVGSTSMWRPGTSRSRLSGRTGLNYELRVRWSAVAGKDCLSVRIADRENRLCRTGY